MKRPREFAPKSNCCIEGWGAAIAAAGAVAGGAISASAAGSAAGTQAQYENQALQQQEQMFQTTQNNESPFIQAGQGAANQLSYLLGNSGTPGLQGSPSQGSSTAGGFGSLNSPFTLQDFYQQSPQYKFNLQQGAQGTLNQAASSQGAESGAALSALEAYNQQDANNSYNSAFANYQTQQNNIFNRLSNIAALGSNAGSAGTTGSAQFANSIGNTTSSIGASLAAGQVGQANAISGGIQGAANTFYNQNALQQLLNGGSTVNYNPTGAAPGGTTTQDGYIIGLP